MAGQRIVMKGKTLDDIAARVREEHGPRARIVEASRVTSGGLGIAGLFSKRYVEATVELPERGRRAAGRPVPDAQAEAFSPTPAQRVGLAALLADADDADEGFDGILLGTQEPGSSASGGPSAAGVTSSPSAPAVPPAPPVPPAPAVSTRSHAFADLMDDLAFNGVVPAPVAAPPAPTPPAVFAPVPQASGAAGRSAGGGAAAPAPSRSSADAPALLDGPGDLIVVLGERPDVVAVAQAIAEGSTGTRPSVRVAGSAVNGRFVAVDDRRTALEARAAGVELDRATIVAVGWDSAHPAAAASIVDAVGPDQVLIAVDAGRKHADTERWFSAATASVAADGLAVYGVAGTSTPETVLSLPLPVGWQDD